jgi:hypothetical protein
MVESTRPVQSRDPFERFDEAINDSRLYDSNQPRLYESSQPRSFETSQPRFESNQPRLYEADHYEQPYALPYERQDTYDRQDTLGDDLPSHEPVPLFLSNYEDEAHQALSEYTFASGNRKKVRTGRIVTGAIAVSAIAALLALFSIDSTRAVIFNASLGGGNSTPAQVAAVAPEPAAAPVVPQRIAAPPLGAEPSPPPSAAPPSAPDVAAARRNTPADAMASTSPSRDEITAAYQTALKGKVAVPEPVAREAARETAPAVAALAPAVREPVPVTREAAPARRIDPDELAALLKRAKSLLAIGDITSARLLLERAADAQEAEAALMLAGTYDPQVLGSQDMRAVTPDPAAAKVWYQKAAQMGSADAKRRLGQLQN